MQANGTPTQRLGLIGDLHAEDSLLEQTLQHLQQLQVDTIACTGDIADGQGCIDRCCDLLAQAGVLTVRGNHDRWLMQDRVRNIDHAHDWQVLAPDSRNYIQSLPTTVTIATTTGDALLCHGIDEQDLAKIWPGSERMPPERSQHLDHLLANDEYRYLFNGHMHFRTIIYFDRLTLVNAGTLKRKHRPGFSVVDFTTQQVQAFEHDGDCFQPAITRHLTPSNDDTVWENTQAFDSNWQPTTLYRTPVKST